MIQDDSDHKLTDNRRSDANQTPIRDKSFPYRKYKSIYRIGRYPEMKCYTCHKMGHIATFCPAKRKSPVQEKNLLNLNFSYAERVR